MTPLQISGTRKLLSASYGAAALIGSAFLTWSIATGAGLGLNDYPYLLLVVLHLFRGLLLLAGRPAVSRRKLSAYLFFPELLFALSLLFFLFSWLFALNANMDYVQRFIETGGGLRLAKNTTEEQLLAGARFLPFLAVNAWAYVSIRITRRSLFRTGGRGAFLSLWALPLTLLSSFLAGIAFPSFLHTDGFGALAWISLVPLFLAISRSSPWKAVFLGICFGVFFTTICNYWLGTFSLVSLLLTIIIFTVFYTLFMIPAVFLHRFIRTGKFLVFPLAWTAFDFLRSQGFLGFPWGMMGLTQYEFLPLIQIASLTGVWGVSFLVVLVNSALAGSADSLLSEKRKPAWAGLTAAGTAVFLSVFGGSMYLILSRGAAEAPGSSVKVALIQQNSDPRKHDYRMTFETLKRLTDRALEEKPDLVVWSETAFVPNIRRWSAVPPETNETAAVVHQFLEYQKSLSTWLLTGNDDYDLTIRDDGTEDRRDYNAAVFFSPEGVRTETYHKIHLVPFTEYFPYRKELPVVYEFLRNFDATLWEPGSERIVFKHPLLSFSTPICFEDAFPDDIRKFVLEGAEAIINISNDYWSLTTVEAKQHYIASLFRAVENRRPLLRATASGLTAYVEPTGRLVASLPYYEEAGLVVEVRGAAGGPLTVYTRYGDWFPVLCLSLLGVLLALRIAGIPFRKQRPEVPAVSGAGDRSVPGKVP